jgi:ATP/maltotriose-dependent transcriptional regulator MalT/two-component SAPR family response regulator
MREPKSSAVATNEQLILETKLQPPTLKDNVIDRPRILNLLDQNLHRKLILIVTDAGYGKTTLVTQFIKEQDLPSVYYNLDNKDSDLMVFFSYLIRGLERIDPNLVTQIKSLLQGGGHIVQHYELFMGSLINEVMNKTARDIYIILDDYHNLAEDSLVHKALNYFIDHLPDKMRVIIASRVLPPFNLLAKWRAKQNLYEIYRDGLRFTDDEIKALFAAFYKQSLSHDALRLVSDKTDGWITGIQLILYSAIKDRIVIEQSLNDFIKTRQPLFDYFTKEILEGESAPVRDFLKRSSILEIMSPADCNHILGIRNAQAILREIERRNLFLNAVGDGQYKYHPLFREFLMRQLVEERKARELHERAARYYELKGEWEPVVEHALAAGDYAQAAEIIIRQSGNMLEQARHDLLKNWLGRFPENFLVGNPRLVVLQGRLFLEKGFPTRANELYNQAEILLRRGGIRKKRNLETWTEALYERGNLFMSEGHYREALKYLEKALRSCPASAQKIRGEILNLIGLAWNGLGYLKKSKHYLLRAKKLMEELKQHCSLMLVECNLTLLLQKQGETKVLHDMFKNLIDKLRGSYCWRAGFIFTKAAKNALEMGNEEWAETCLNEGLALCQLYNDPKSIAVIYTGLGALNIDKEHWDRAQNYLEIAVQEYRKLGWFKMKSINLCFARLNRYLQNFETLKKYLKNAQDNYGKEKTQLETDLLIEYGLYEMAQGNLSQAKEIFKRSLNLSQTAGWKKEEFAALLAEAEVAVQERKENEARRKIDKALYLAKIKGYDGILKCELQHRPKLWSLVQRTASQKMYVASLRLTQRPLIIRVRFLGGLVVSDEKMRPLAVKWSSEKTRSLFSYMAIHRSAPVHREMILDQVWPDLDPARANVNFRNTATRLRQALACALNGQLAKDDIFVFRHKKYQLLAGAQLILDTEEFENLLKEAHQIDLPETKARMIGRAIDLYHGDFLPENYDAWADTHRHRLRENLLNNLHWLAGYAARSGDYPTCIAACEKYLNLEPYSEEITRLCMQVLVRLGQVSAIKIRYDRLKKALRQELHCAPSLETRELYRSLISTQKP